MNNMIATITEFINKYTKIEDTELFHYGLRSLIKYIIFLIILIPICIYLNNLKESFIFLLLFILIRIHVGGYHLNNAYTCLIVSVSLICLIPYFLIRYPLTSFINFILFIIGACFLIIYAPVAHDKKKITLSERKYFKRKIKVLLMLYLLLLILFELINDTNITTIISFSIFINALNVFIALIKKRRIQDAKNVN